MPWDLHHPRPTELLTQKHFPSIRRLKKDRVQRPWKPDETGWNRPSQVKSQMSHSWVTWAWKIQEREKNRTDSTDRSLFILFCFYWKDIVWQNYCQVYAWRPKVWLALFHCISINHSHSIYGKRVRIRRSARQQKAQDFSGDSLVLRQVEKFGQSCWYQLILQC